MPAGFILDLIRYAIKRGASRLILRLESKSLSLDDDAPAMKEGWISQIFDLTRSDLADATRERIIHDMLDPPGLGLISAFAAQPESLRFYIRHDDKECRRIDLEPGSRIKITTEPCLSASTNNRTILFNGNGNFLAYLPLIRSACVMAGAGIEINGFAVKRGSLLKNVLLSRHFRLPPFPGTMEIALPESGEKCRIVLTDQGIPWDEISMPPQGGFVFDLQIETTRPPGDAFAEHWIPVARQLYSIAVREFSSQKQPHRLRLEELFFLYHNLTGNTALFREVPLFLSSLQHQRLSLSQIKEKASENPLPFRFLHQPPLLSSRRRGTFLRLSTRQVDFLARAGIPFRQIHDPIPGHPPIFLRLRRIFHRLKVAVSRIIYFRRTRIAFSESTESEKALINQIFRQLPAASDSSAPAPATHWIPVVLNCRGILPIWPEKRLAGYNLMDLSVARHHPDIRKAIQRYEEDPESIEVIAAQFRPLLPL